MSIDPRARCQWAYHSPLLLEYHDREWGVPLHDDVRLYELLVLEGMQAGLSWETVLKKRENFRRAFQGFDPTRVSRYEEADMARLLTDEGIIRNRAKVQAAITNAGLVLTTQDEFHSFDAYVWRFVGGRPRQNRFASLSDLPAKTPESEAMSKDLRGRGFRFVGPTICYAFMQAAGLVNDHTTDCYRHEELGGK